MPYGHVPRDGQAQTGPAVVPAARRVQPYEPLEDPLTVGLGHPLAVVGDAHHGLAALPAHGHRDPLTGVPLRVVQQVGEHPPQLPA